MPMIGTVHPVSGRRDDQGRLDAGRGLLLQGRLHERLAQGRVADRRRRQRRGVIAGRATGARRRPVISRRLQRKIIDAR